MTENAPARRRLVPHILIATAVAVIGGGALVATVAAQPAGRPPRPEGDRPARPERPDRDGQRGPRPEGREMRGAPHDRALFEAIGLRVRPDRPDRPRRGEAPEAAEPAANADAKPTTGLVVANVALDSAAAKAGIQEGDRITKLGDQIIVNPPQLVTLLALQDAGASVSFDLTRNGDTANASVTLDDSALGHLRRGANAPGSPPRGEGGPRGGPREGGPRGDRPNDRDGEQLPPPPQGDNQ